MKKLLIFFLFNISINASAQLFLTECDVINDVMDYVVYLSRGSNDTINLYYIVNKNGFYDEEIIHDDSYNNCFKGWKNVYLWKEDFQPQENGGVINIYRERKRKTIVYSILQSSFKFLYG